MEEIKGCVTVYDTLKACDKEKLYKAVLCSYGDAETGAKSSRATMRFVESCLRLAPSGDPKWNAVIVEKIEDSDEEDFFDTYALNFDGQEGLCAFLSVLNSSSCFPNAGQKTRNIGCAYEFQTTAEILSYCIPDICFKTYGVETVLATILYEMTFFGFEETEIEKEKGGVFKSILDAEKEVVGESR